MVTVATAICLPPTIACVLEAVLASILIVDDDPTVRLIGAELLRGEDYAIMEADDGDVAMKIIAAVPVDMLILDILMPRMDGLEVIRSVKRTYPAIKILAISSGGHRAGAVSYLETARVFGADEVMVKPLRMATFAMTVARLLAEPTRSANPWTASVS